MHNTRKLVATTMIAAAGAVGTALALSPAAAAQPAPPAPAPTPSIPGLPFIQQLASNPAAASQLMQGFANVMGNATTPAAPASPAPAATASVTLPQPPLNTPAATAPATAAQNATSNVPFLPGDLAALLPAGASLANLLPAATTAAAPAAPVAAAPVAATPNASVAPLLMPLSALP